MYKLVLLRHGESLWNKTNRFTGWVDVELSEKGATEAITAGNVLKEAGYSFDIAYTSLLKRAIKTLWLALEQMDLMWIPVVNSWHLNERHYGALQGLNKTETADEHGEDQVLIWRRSYSIPPPALTEDSKYYPGSDLRYVALDKSKLPLTECLEDTYNRFLPYWNEQIAPTIISGKNVLITAHGNSLRALIKDLESLSEDQILQVNIPTGLPLVYQLDTNLKPIDKFYLGNEAEVQKAMEVIANQGKSKK